MVDPRSLSPVENASVTSPETSTSKPSAPNHPQATVVRRADLPLSCPLPDAPVWNQHPKVYLPIEKDGHAKCPYCGADYVLED